MQQYLIMCRSLTYAQRASRLLESLGITATLARAPQALSGNGCGYSVIVSFKRGPRAVSILKDADLLQGRVYIKNEDGGLKEAEL